MFADPNDYDQRGTGFQRVINGRVDMGAFELHHVQVNDNSSDTDDGLPDNGITTLREAVNLANESDNQSLITFDPSLSGKSINLVGELEITETLTIDATTLETGVTIDAAWVLQGLSRGSRFWGRANPA